MATATHIRTDDELYIPHEYRFTREQFEEIADSGIFPPEARLELIEGRIVWQEAPMKSAHAVGVRRAETAMQRVFREGHDVRCQLPLALHLRDEPLPDVAVVIGTFEDYETDHPTTAVLVIEVSDTTLRYDRTTKAGIYARANIPEYWIVDLTGRVLIVHRQPASIPGRTLEHGYESVVEYAEAESVSPLTIPDASVLVSDLLPRRRIE
jgi:Uma2 family endonuclease